jgi:4-aminobutyrate aminotransferase-like enzyme
MHGNVVRILVPLNANVEELETGFSALRGAFEAAYQK